MLPDLDKLALSLVDYYFELGSTSRVDDFVVVEQAVLRPAAFERF